MSKEQVISQIRDMIRAHTEGGVSSEELDSFLSSLHRLDDKSLIAAYRVFQTLYSKENDKDPEPFILYGEFE